MVRGFFGIGIYHPIGRRRSCYLLGNESTGLPQEVLDKCHHKLIVQHAKHCLNVMHDRKRKELL